MNIAVTGGTGFIGNAVITGLLSQNYHVVAAVRSEDSSVPKGAGMIRVGGLSAETDWSSALKRIDVVVHTAARAHIMNDSAADPLAEFRKVNTAGTLNLARQAASAGVKRFIFISSIGVNGNCDTHPFTESDIVNPQEPYAVSKWEAEQGLVELGKGRREKGDRRTGMEVVIIRPPLVCGANAPGNFGRLVKWVKRGVPLPLGAVHNKRSFVALDNLVSFIIHCMDHPRAANKVFLISDGEDVSTTELLQKMARAFGKRSLLLPVPVALMTFAAGLLGKKDVADRLFGSLQVDSSKARDLLGWTPVVSMDEGLIASLKDEKT
jgi:nucleoside-diphosphate-sugar epimerase